MKKSRKKYYNAVKKAIFLLFAYLFVCIFNNEIIININNIVVF